MKHLTIVCVLLIYGVVFLSCGETPFSLVRAAGAITVYDDKVVNKQYEFLSAWLTFRNADSLGDISIVYIAHDASELYWTLNEGSWKQTTENNSQILLVRLRMHDFTPLPRGPYRVIVQSYGGEESLAQLFISPRLTLNIENIPKFTVSDSGQRSIRFPFTLNYVFGIDQNNFPYNIRQASTFLVITSSLQSSYDEMYFYSPAERQGGYLSGPY